MRKLLIILFIFLTGAVHAEKQPVNDSSTIVVRSITAASINAYKENKSFNYTIEPIEQPTIWDKFWLWFWQKVDDIMSTKGGKNTVYTILIAFGISALAFLIFKINKMNKTSLFAGGGNGAIQFTIEEEDINNINFDAAIAAALQDNNYRLAIRLVYLQTLKHLSDRAVIDWQLNKTNHNYELEIQASELRTLFIQLTDIFEFVWYGNAAIGEERYVAMQVKFNDIKNTLK